MEEAIKKVQDYINELGLVKVDLSKDLTELEKETILKIDPKEAGPLMVIFKKITLSYSLQIIYQYERIILHVRFTYVHPTGSNGYKTSLHFDINGNFLSLM